MALLLSLETSTSVCSVAIHREGQLLALQEINELGAHSAKLMGLLHESLAQASCELSDVDAIVVSSGPGSYTGLRIGISAAKGLAFSLDKPIIGVSAMELLAQAAANEIEEHALIIPMLDARRMEVYSQVFNYDLTSMEEVHPVILGESSFENYLSESKVYFIGDGVAKARQLISNPNALFLDTTISAREMGQVGWSKYLRKDFENLAYFAPNYLKEFRVLKSKKNLLMK